jgi:predicted enzyme related to lactoylglutathione lyase
MVGMANSVCHFEIFAGDVPRARAFYEEVFGWRFEAWGPPDAYLVHVGVDGDPGIRQGLLAPRDGVAAAGALNAFRCTISVRSVEASMQAIERAGGTLRSPLVAVFGVGRFVEFADPDGNVACAMQYEPGNPLAAREGAR